MIIIFPEKLNTFVYLLKVIIYLFYVDLKKYSLLVTEIRRIVHNYKITTDKIKTVCYIQENLQDYYLSTLLLFFFLEFKN